MSHLRVSNDSTRAYLAHLQSVASDLFGDITDLFARFSALQLAHSKDLEALRQVLVRVTQERDELLIVLTLQRASEEARC